MLSPSDLFTDSTGVSNGEHFSSRRDMPEISPSEVPNDNFRMLQRVEPSERFAVVRGRAPAAEVVPAQQRLHQTRAELAEAAASLPAVDADQPRANLDAECRVRQRDRC